MGVSKVINLQRTPETDFCQNFKSKYRSKKVGLVEARPLENTILVVKGSISYSEILTFTVLHFYFFVEVILFTF